MHGKSKWYDSDRTRPAHSGQEAAVQNVIVVGYEGRKLMDYVSSLTITTPIIFIHNDVYDRTNNIYSLALAKQYLVSEDTLLLESDIIFEESLVDILIDDPRETLALVDKFASWMDGTCMVLDSDDSIKRLIPWQVFEV